MVFLSRSLSLVFLVVVVCTWFDRANGQGSLCNLNISGGRSNVTAALLCTGEQVIVSVGAPIRGPLLTHRGVLLSTNCGIPGCLVTVCTDTISVMFDNSSVAGVTSRGIESVLCVSGTTAVLIRNSTFLQNSARAVLVLNRSQVTIDSSSVIAFNVVPGGDGAAVRVSGSARVSITCSRSSNNLASNGDGGAVHADGISTVNISGSTVSRNACGRHGGGLSLVQNATVTLRGGYIANNTAEDGWQVFFGGAVGHACLG